jgi:chromosome segregation ATPase
VFSHGSCLSTKKSLEESRAELATSKDEYTTLKERVKLVAGELKERRVECRTLQSEVELLQSNNTSLHDKITALEAQGMDMNQSTKDTMEQVNSLKANLMDREKELEEARKATAAEEKKGADAMSTYKKKAQQSLAVANARTASAVQSKEEAEMEARAARSTADSAMERALTAERNGKDAMAEAKSYVGDMQKEVAKLDEIKQALESATTELERVRFDAKTSHESNSKAKCELQSVTGRLEAEQKTSDDIREEVRAAEYRSTELMEEVDRLRRESQKLRDALERASAAKSQAESKNAKTATTSSSGAEAQVRTERSAEAEATISMLRQELQDANKAIKELKETLMAAVEEGSRGQYGPAPTANGDHHHGGGDAGIPLFYAMEKQAELTQARNEIARMAGLLGDAESGKQEAMDAMDDMRRMLEEAEARLKREAHKSPEEERVNLEYLKNIMLSYLNAKTVQEKKALLPVIGTVLCLTPQEQRKAMEGLDKGGGRVLDSVASSMLNLKWS